MSKVCVALAGLALVVSVSVGSAAAEPSRPFKVVANLSVAGQKIPRQTLAQIYLGTAQRWTDGRPIVPVDLSITSGVREAFSGVVLGLPVDGVKNYWLRSVASGKRPPVIKGSDEEVIAFVAAEPGGIGYVSEATPVPSNVLVMAVQ